MPNKQEKKKKSISINPFVLFICIMAIAVLATYFVTPGTFDREVLDGKTVIVPDSYHEIDQEPLGVFSIFQAIPNGLAGAAEIMFLVMLVGGCLEVYNQTGSIDKGMARIIGLSEKVGGGVILSGIMVVFALIGGFLGWAEQIIPFIPLVISLCLALGYDPVVGVAVSGLIDYLSFSASPTNVYTVGISHEIAGLPMFSGMGFRFLVLIVVNIIAQIYILRYAKKVKEDPSKSLMADIDTSDLEIDYASIINEKMTSNQIISLLVFGITFAVSIYGVSQKGWSFNDLTAAFVFSGIASGLICRLSPSKIANSFVEGSQAAFGGAAVIGLARGIQWLLQEGGLIDPIINALSKPLMGLPTWATAIGVFIVISILNGLIPSGSGKAMAFMPILTPLADLVGLTRQTMVLAYQFGDGLTNSFWFTNGALLIFLRSGKIPLGRWYKFIAPLLLVLGVVFSMFLIAATYIGYGPF